MGSDKTLDHEAVKIYRDIFHFCPNAGFRSDIVVTVTNLDLWKSILSTWGHEENGKWKRHNPLNVKGMIQEYERRKQNGTNAANGRDGERKRPEKDMQVRVSERRFSHLSCMPENAGVRFRANSKTLEEIVTEALSKNNRSEAEIAK